MEPSDKNFKPEKQTNGKNQEYPNHSPRIKSLSSYELNNFIKNLSHPKFLGSIHLNKEAMSPYNRTIENLVNNELDLKMHKSLKNTILNPITLTLIFIAIIFNIAYIIFLYL